MTDPIHAVPKNAGQETEDAVQEAESQEADAGTRRDAGGGTKTTEKRWEVGLFTRSVTTTTTTPPGGGNGPEENR